MNTGIVIHYLAKAMLIGTLLFLIPAAVSLCYGEYFCALIFLLTCAGTAAVFGLFSLYKPKRQQIRTRESMVIAALLWLIFSVVSALPFYFTGEIPDIWNAIFESVSGFTTTGATILSDVECLSHSLSFWRCFSHWIGGMGVLVLAIAILPSSGDAIYLMRAECPGPSVSKLVPKGKNSALYLYLIYIGLTLLTFLFLLFGGMPVFDSICHAMSVAGTGGFSIKNAGIAAYGSAYIEGVLTVAMILFGINFSLYYFILMRQFHEVKKNTEIKVYLTIMALATILMMCNTYSIYQSVGKTFRAVIFQAASIMTSTGFATEDFVQWPMFSQMILLCLMFIGGCSGSTGGGFKVQRVVLLGKSGQLSPRKLVYSNSVNTVKSDGKTLSTDVVHGVMRYLVIYLGIAVFSVLLLSLKSEDFTATVSSVLSCLSNNGPALGSLGPMENYSGLFNLSKMVLCVDMLLGRLECLPLLILFMPAAWRRDF